jgi:hypothetical protein
MEGWFALHTRINDDALQRVRASDGPVRGTRCQQQPRSYSAQDEELDELRVHRRALTAREQEFRKPAQASRLAAQRLAGEQGRIEPMRNSLVAASAACALASPALAVETSNFNLATTGDLVALCSAQPDEPLYGQALQFCYGYMAGMAQFHRALVQADDIEPQACPQHEVTREALVQVFLDWRVGNRVPWTSCPPTA